MKEPFEMSLGDAAEILRWGEDAAVSGTWLGGRSADLWTRLLEWHNALRDGAAERLREKERNLSPHLGCDDPDCLHWGYEKPESDDDLPPSSDGTKYTDYREEIG